eukprot:TRINITY_DN40415_c0_g1_i1.p3 TRINITY_DN40415_c0_g1~~TRINITY_DN40415_c0_g1_i1.p3  ORF type:complete len:154 (+),score=23.56 TRINITY_DN40415_c0_g1_i1:28-462(+)
MATAASPDLLWALVCNSSSFLVKRNGVTFTKEPMNLTQKNQFKYSGLVARRAVGIVPTEKGAVLKMKLPKASQKRMPKSSVRSVPLTRDARRGARTIASEIGISHYRRDLQAAALARWSKIKKSLKPVKPTPTRPPKGRRVRKA